MFCVTVDEKVIAIHDDKEVVEEYARLYQYYHKDADIRIGKIKDKKAIKYDDLYLEMVGESFIQTKFMDCFNYGYLRSQIAEDNKKARNVLMRILSNEELDNKEKKHIKKTIELLEEYIYEDEKYVPTMKDLEYYKSQVDSLLYNIYGKE